jgi:hypothetical protein
MMGEYLSFKRPFHAETRRRGEKKLSPPRLRVNRFPYDVCVRYRVVLHESEEGFAVACAGLPGCWSQGATEAEALDNIRSAIEEYLEALKSM